MVDSREARAVPTLDVAGWMQCYVRAWCCHRAHSGPPTGLRGSNRLLSAFTAFLSGRAISKGRRASGPSLPDGRGQPYFQALFGTNNRRARRFCRFLCRFCRFFRGVWKRSPRRWGSMRIENEKLKMEGRTAGPVWAGDFRGFFGSKVGESPLWTGIVRYSPVCVEKIFLRENRARSARAERIR